MEMKMAHHDSLLKPPPDDSIYGILWATGLALLVHLLLVAMLAYAPRMHSPRRHFQPAIQVDLVSPVLLRSAASPQQVPAAAQATAIPAKKKMDGVRKPKKIKSLAEPADNTTAQSSADISEKKAVVSSRPVKKHALKKKTYQADRVAKIKVEHKSQTEASSRPAEKKTVKDSRGTVASRQSPEKQIKPSVSDDVFERLRSRVEKQTQEQRATAFGSGAGGKGQGAATDLETAYLYQVADEIQRNWAFSRRLAGNRENLRAVLFFKIMPDGKILDIVFETRSGNRYLDESAYKAIIKSNPVQPHPPGINKPVVVAAYGFTPEGME
jgi:colicin import membrane protein